MRYGTVRYGEDPYRTVLVHGGYPGHLFTFSYIYTRPEAKDEPNSPKYSTDEPRRTSRRVSTEPRLDYVSTRLSPDSVWLWSGSGLALAWPVWSGLVCH